MTELDTLQNIQNNITTIEEKLDTVISKLIPLVDILQTIIKTNINKDTKETKGVNSKEEIPDLAFRVDSGTEFCNRNVYIYGKKTYDNKDTIKKNFNCRWVNSSWVFDYEEGVEKKIFDLFPDIIKQ